MPFCKKCRKEMPWEARDQFCESEQAAGMERHSLVAALKPEKGLSRPVGGRPKRSFTPASDEQRDDIRKRASIMPGSGPIDPGHITPRAHGGCDDPLCVVPLYRTAHLLFDDGKLDILGAMIANGLYEEMGHAVSVHRQDPITLLQRLTGHRWAPVNDNTEVRRLQNALGDISGMQSDGASAEEMAAACDRVRHGGNVWDDEPGEQAA